MAENPKFKDQTYNFTHQPIIRVEGNSPVVEWLQRALALLDEDQTTQEENITQEENKSE